MRRRISTAAVAGLFAAFIFILAGCSREKDAPMHLLGAYRYPDGRLVSIRASSDGTLRYTEYATGESRRLNPAGGLRYEAGPGFVGKEPVEVTAEFTLGENGAAESVAMSFNGGPQSILEFVSREKWVTFFSGEIELRGRIDLPPGPGPFPAVVFAHGSGKDPATEFMSPGDFYSQNGIAAFTFDKRGTGRSEGAFTMDFHQLAKDVAAAVEFLASRPEIDRGRIGVSGYSQGGWIGPLAASMSPRVKWVIVNYGMIESPAYEARMETIDLLKGRGVGGDDLAKADELTVAAVDLVAGGLRGGWEEFGAAREKYRGEPWMKQFDGSPVGYLLKYPRWLVRLAGPRMLPPGLTWRYESTAVLDTLGVPMAWLLGGMDRGAPNEKTIETLQRLMASGKPYELVIFPDADHGMIEFREEQDGSRVPLKYSTDFFTMQIFYARKFSGLEGQTP
jgi:hypothetical protein